MNTDTQLAQPEGSAVALIREVVSYDPHTGLFTWAKSRGGCVAAGKRAGRWHPDGYWRINIFRKEYLAHRLAWLMTHGKWPICQIDHINGVRSDNRLVNLREATPEQNARNCALNRNNKSGLKGVSLKKGRWVAQIAYRKRKIHIGYFLTKEAAGAAYAEKAKALFGEYLRKTA